MKSFILLLFLLFSVGSWGQLEREKDILKTLCSPDFHGRGYVKDGVNKAADYIAKQFEISGALPAGEKNSYFHHLSLSVNTFPGKMEVSSKEKQFIPGIHYLVNSSSGSFVGEVKLISLDVFKVIQKEKKETKKLEKLKENEAILLDLTKYKSRDTIRLMNEVATAMADLHPVVIKTDEKFMWSVGRIEKKYPIVLIQDSVFQGLKKLKINIVNQFVRDFKTKNVVAKIPGKSSDSCFVFTAHYDHLGRMGSETYFPGANDNASGTTMLISLAAYYSANKPEYDIYFIAFTAEEAGLVGSKAFVEDPTFDIHKIKFLLNLDIMGSGDEGITAVNGTIHKKEFDLLKQLNEKKDLLKIVKPRGKTQNSDHYFFQEQGILTFFIYTMGKNKAYHDIFDRSDSLDLLNFDDLKTLLVDFIQSYP